MVHLSGFSYLFEYFLPNCAISRLMAPRILSLISLKKYQPVEQCVVKKSTFREGSFLMASQNLEYRADKLHVLLNISSFAKWCWKHGTIWDLWNFVHLETENLAEFPVSTHHSNLIGSRHVCHGDSSGHKMDNYRQVCNCLSLDPNANFRL